jgi:hypothetical protein
MPIMYVVKFFDRIALEWAVIGYFGTQEDAELYQDRLWLDQPETLTEVEYRGF